MSGLMGQEQRFLQWTNNLNASLILLKVVGSEILAEPYVYTFHFYSEIGSEQVFKNLGKNIGCLISDGHNQRYINGVLTSLCEVTREDNIIYYEGRVEPKLKLLSLSAQCRVYQKKTVPEIVESVLKAAGIRDLQIKLQKQYAKREYCIQYRESDLNFIVRLLNDEGIYYFFEHQADKHILILADHASAHTTTKNSPLLFTPKQGGQGKPGINSWINQQSVSLKSCQISGYSVAKATTLQSNKVSDSSDLAIENITYTDHYPIEEQQTLNQIAENIIQQRESMRSFFSAKTECHWLACGEIFQLKGHASDDGEYIISTINLSVDNNFETEMASFDADFTAISSRQKYTPSYDFSATQIQSVLTAEVVGPQSEEVHIDKYGRIKIQFYWDTENKHDDSSSCWIRVAQMWSGAKFGAQFIPRVGNEVVVSFVDGNPDYPIVTGMLFNGKNLPPLDLPNEKTRSVLYSRSTAKGGSSDGHQIIFEDKKGSESLILKSQKDLVCQVTHDLNQTVGNNANYSIKKDRVTTLEQGNDTLTLSQGNCALDLKQGNYSIDLSTGNFSTKLSAGSFTQKISAGGCDISCAQTCKIESMQSLELVVGTSKITLSPASITLSAMSINIQSQVSAELKGSMVQINGEGMLQLSGGVTMIG